MREVIRFYGECFKRAFSGVFWRVEQLTGGLGLLLLTVSRFVLPNSQYSEMIEVDAPLYFLLVAFFVTVFIGFIVAPVDIYKEEQERTEKERQRREALELKWQPSMKVLIADSRGSRIANGTSSETYGGSRHTSYGVILDSALSLVIENIGNVRLKNVHAKIISIDKTEGQNAAPLPMTRPIELSWDFRSTEENLSVDIDAKERRNLWVGWVRPQGQLFVLRDTDCLPVEYQQYFGDAGTYQATVMIASDNTSPLEVKIEVSAQAADRDVNVYRTGGIARIAILEQSSPSSGS